jgi:hypothetical protein
MDVWNWQKIKDGMCGLDLPQRTNIKSQDQPTRYATFISPQAQKTRSPENPKKIG